MPQFDGQLGTWELPHFHRWKDRTKELKFERHPLIDKNTFIATIGSCFAVELAKGMKRFGLNGQQHPDGLFYTSRTIRQELDRIFGKWENYRLDPPQHTKKGWIHPFKALTQVFETQEQLAAWSDEVDAQASLIFKKASVIVITLGLVESWISRKTGNHYRQIPHPDVFAELNPDFHRMTVKEIREDLECICDLISKSTGAKIIFTVSPIPLHATFTSLDVRIASNESKARLRAAVSELVADRSDVFYFPSYEIVVTSERMSDFMLEDGRHVSRQGADYIINQFLSVYGCDDISIPPMNLDWLTSPQKTAEWKPRKPLIIRRLIRIAKNLLRVFRKGNTR